MDDFENEEVAELSGPVRFSEHCTIDQIKQFVNSVYAGKCHPNSLEFKSAVILIAATIYGSDLEAIARFTGYSLKRNIVQNCLERIKKHMLVDSRISLRWLDQSEMPDPEKTVNIILDFMVVSGATTRTPEDDDFRYSLTEKETRKVERMAKRSW